MCAIKLHFKLNKLLTWHINYIRCYMLFINKLKQIKMDIAEKIQEQSTKLFEELKTKSKILVTNEEYDNGDDLIYEMPRIYMVTKHSFYVEYVILEIQEGGILKCGGVGEDFGELITTDISELTTDDACALFNCI